MNSSPWMRKKPGFFDRLFSRKPETYRNMMEALIYDVAKKGEGVITGHGAMMLLRDFSCAFHVRLGASVDTRVQKLTKTQGVNRETARKIIQKQDRDKAGFMEFLFQKDWNDATLYDLFVNLDKLAPETAAALIVNAARANEMKTCSLSALESMENLVLAHKVEAAVLKGNFDITSLNVEVPEKGEVVVFGWIDSDLEKEAFIDTVKAVPGVTRTDIRVFSVPFTS